MNINISKSGLITTIFITDVRKLDPQYRFLPVHLSSGFTMVTDGHPLCRTAPVESEEHTLPTGFTDIY